MGLPVWQPSSPDSSKNATERDPTASSRSAIRRRRIADIGSQASSSSLPQAPLPRMRRDIDDGPIQVNRSREYELHRLAEASRLRASELRVARQSLRAANTNLPPAGYVPYDYANIPEPYVPRAPRQYPPSSNTTASSRRVSSSDTSAPAPASAPRNPLNMYEQTQALRNQISQLRESLQRHQAHDAALREHAAPWLEPDQQLHSDNPAVPYSALHALRSPLSELATLLQEVEYDFRDPMPEDEEEQFRVSVRAQYAEDHSANPHRYDRRFGWDEEMTESFWEQEHFRRLPSGALIPSYQGMASPPPPRSPGFFSSRVVASPRRFTVRPSRPTSPPGGPVASSGRTIRNIPEAPLSPAPRFTMPGSIDGLGDRELSVGPSDEQWLIMQSTVAPDDTLPSADSSFTSAAASASFSASRSQSADSSAPTSYVDEDEWDANCP